MTAWSRVKSENMNNIFTVQKDKSVTVKCKLTEKARLYCYNTNCVVFVC